MLRDEDYFEDQELSLVYIAKKLGEALKLEGILTEAGVDYFVEPDRYKGGLLFASERVGAFFYVPLVNLPSTREVLERNGFKPYQTPPD